MIEITEIRISARKARDKRDGKASVLAFIDATLIIGDGDMKIYGIKMHEGKDGGDPWISFPQQPDKDKDKDKWWNVVSIKPNCLLSRVIKKAVLTTYAGMPEGTNERQKSFDLTTPAPAPVEG